MSVDELEKAVAELPPDKLASFQAWFEEFVAAQWDRQIERDAENGILDKLFEGAMADFKAGRVKEI